MHRFTAVTSNIKIAIAINLRTHTHTKKTLKNTIQVVQRQRFTQIRSSIQLYQWKLRFRLEHSRIELIFKVNYKIKEDQNFDLNLKTVLCLCEQTSV